MEQACPRGLHQLGTSLLNGLLSTAPLTATEPGETYPDPSTPRRLLSHSPVLLQCRCQPKRSTAVFLGSNWKWEKKNDHSGSRSSVPSWTFTDSSSLEKRKGAGLKWLTAVSEELPAQKLAARGTQQQHQKWNWEKPYPEQENLHCRWGNLWECKQQWCFCNESKGQQEMERGPGRSLFMLLTGPEALIIISKIFCLIQSGGSLSRHWLWTTSKANWQMKSNSNSRRNHLPVTRTHDFKVQQAPRKDVLFEIMFTPALVKCISNTS